MVEKIGTRIWVRIPGTGCYKKSGDFRKGINDTMDELPVKGCGKLLDYAISFWRPLSTRQPAPTGRGSRLRPEQVARWRDQVLGHVPIKQSELQ